MVSKDLLLMHVEQFGGLGPCFLIGLNLQIHYFFLVTTLSLIAGIIVCMRWYARPASEPLKKLLKIAVASAIPAAFMGVAATLTNAKVFTGEVCRDAYGQPIVEISLLPWTTLGLIIVFLLFAILLPLRVATRGKTITFIIIAGILGALYSLFWINILSA